MSVAEGIVGVLDARCEYEGVAIDGSDAGGAPLVLPEAFCMSGCWGGGVSGVDGVRISGAKTNSASGTHNTNSRVMAPNRKTAGFMNAFQTNPAMELTIMAAVAKQTAPTSPKVVTMSGTTNTARATTPPSHSARPTRVYGASPARTPAASWSKQSKPFSTTVSRPTAFARRHNGSLRNRPDTSSFAMCMSTASRAARGVMRVT
jgi:hypothetical protein